MKRTTLIGAAIPRPDAVDKVRGEAKYADDLAFSGMLHASVVRSPHPHARLVGLDADEARSFPGVVAVLTAADVPGTNIVHVIVDDQPALAADVVRYVGEPVALVVAETRRQARAAAAVVRVEYEVLPYVADPLAALAPGAPQVAAPGAAESGNLFSRMVLDKGDVDRALAVAAAVVDGVYETGYQEHAYLETQGAVAVPEELGAMAVYGSMQCPFYVQNAVAKVLGLPLAKVRVVAAATGGAFGGKEDVPSLIGSLAAIGAWATRRPVKLVLGRAEDVLTTSKRHPSVVRYKTAADAAGKILAIDVDIVLNAGAYQTLSSAVLWRSLITAAGPYRVPNVRVVARSAATNTVPNGAFRGFGSPQVIFPHESQMDLLAEQLGLDRVEIRRRNVLHAGDRTSTDHLVEDSVGVAKTLERAAALADWPARLERTAAHNRASFETKRGVGVACVLYGVGLGGKAPFLDKAGATIKLEADGSVGIAIGTVEIGQGLATAVLQVAAEGLSIPVEMLHLSPVDTSRVPDSGPTVASRGTMMSALAVMDATAKLRERIERVAKTHKIPKREISLRLSEIAHHFWIDNLDPAVEGFAATEPVNWDPATGLGNAYPVYAYATHIAEVEVDIRTGETRVLDVVAVHDSGRILNRALAAGQVEGGVAQGIGFALMESIDVKDGRLVANGFTTYRVPTIRDVPSLPTVDFVEDPFPAGPFGMKGIGEVPLMAAHAAIARAVAHATGRRLSRYPLDPPRVRSLLTENA